MDIDIKKDLTSNWFKLLQNTICDDIVKLERNKFKFKSTSWKRNTKKKRGRWRIQNFKQWKNI